MQCNVCDPPFVFEDIVTDLEIQNHFIDYHSEVILQYWEEVALND